MNTLKLDHRYPLKPTRLDYRHDLSQNALCNRYGPVTQRLDNWHGIYVKTWVTEGTWVTCVSFGYISYLSLRLLHWFDMLTMAQIHLPLYKRYESRKLYRIGRDACKNGTLRLLVQLFGNGGRVGYRVSTVCCVHRSWAFQQGLADPRNRVNSSNSIFSRFPLLHCSKTQQHYESGQVLSFVCSWKRKTGKMERQTYLTRGILFESFQTDQLSFKQYFRLHASCLIGHIH
jgi:hypothetical protein